MILADSTCATAGACPASFGPDGGACAPDAGACEYPEGRCACERCTDDAGLVSGSQWTCRAWTDIVAQMIGDGGPADASACDVTRPRLGTACDAGAIVCGYDSCVGVSLGYYETCSNGLWAMGPQTDLCNLDQCK